MDIDTKTYTGTVKWFGSNGRHYGFIAPDDGSKEIFVHISSVGHAGLKEIKQGDRLEYSVEVDKHSGKACAANLKLIRGPHTKCYSRKRLRLPKTTTLS